MQPDDRLTRLRKFLTQIAPDQEIGRLQDSLQARASAPTMERLESVRRPIDQRATALDTLDVLVKNADARISPVQEESLEAIIHKVYRPVVDIVNNSFSVPPAPWQHLSQATSRAKIEGTLRSIGRIEIVDDPTGRPYAGTGFIVGQNRLMTNRHVAELFAHGLGARNLGYRTGRAAAIDFKHEIDSTESIRFDLCEPLLIHPYWDMALFKIDGLPDDVLPLKLSTRHPADLVGDGRRDVVTIGYPGSDQNNDLKLQWEIFHGVFNVKRLQPGKLQPVREFRSFGHTVLAVTHDCSTLGGNSGSAVVDVDSGQVLALHFAGRYLDANYGVATYDLASDPRVLAEGLNFQGDTPPPNSDCAGQWKRIEASEVQPVEKSQSTKPAMGRRVASARPTFLSGRARVVSPPSSLQIPLQITMSIGTPQRIFPEAPGALQDLATARTAGERSAAMAIEAALPFTADSLANDEFDWKAALSTALACQLVYAEAAEAKLTALGTWQLATCEFIAGNDIECLIASFPKATLVAFRGTANVGNWLADLNALSTATPWGRIHRGFLRGLQEVESRLKKIVTALEPPRLVLTGHSLGGALATVAAAKWHAQYPISAVYTFGQPRVGNSAFEGFLDPLIGGKFYRFVNDDDIVPRVPPCYKHVGKLFHFDAGGDLSSANEAIAQNGPNELPALSQAQFDELRARLLLARAHCQEIDTAEAVVAAPELEGLFRSFADHRLSEYIAKIARHAV